MNSPRFEKTRSKILDAATGVFAEKGFKATTTKGIASQAGISEVTLFRHFKSKPDLFKEILRRITDQGFTASNVIREDLPPESGIRYLVNKMLELFEEHPSEYRVLHYAILDQVEKFEEKFISNNVVPGLAFLESAFGELSRQNRTTAALSPETLSKLLVTHVLGIADRRIFMKSSPLHPLDRSAICDSLLSLYILPA